MGFVSTGDYLPQSINSDWSLWSARCRASRGGGYVSQGGAGRGRSSSGGVWFCLWVCALAG